MYDNNNPIFTVGTPNPTPPEKKSKKKWIILAITILVLAGITTTTIIVLPNLTAPTWADAHKAFNIYSNYLLFGEKSDKNLEGQYYRTDIYKMERIVYESSHDEISSYYDEVQALFDIFLEKYKSSQQIQNNSTPIDYIKYLNDETIADHERLLKFFHKVAITADIGDRDILTEKYLTNGEASAMEYISQNSIFDDSKNEEMQIYGALKLEQATSLLKVLNTYNNNGCIKNGKLIEGAACSISQTSQNIIQENMAQFIQARNSSANILSAERDELLLHCWKISNELLNMADDE